MKRVSLIGLIGTSTILVGVLAYIASTPSTASSSHTTTIRTTVQPAVAVVVPTTMPVSHTPTVQRRVSSQLQQQFATATDLRAFAHDAMLRPGEGGYFYAMMAISECVGSPQLAEQLIAQTSAMQLKFSATISTRTLQAQTRLQQQCAGFAPGEVGSLLDQVQSLARADSQAHTVDPLLQSLQTAIRAYLQYQQLSAANPEQQRDKAVAYVRAVSDALKYNDSQLQTPELIIKLSAFNADGSSWFEGTRFSYQDPASLPPDSLRVMLELAQCSMGPGCMLERQMLAHCAVGPQCFEDKIAFSRIMFVQSQMGTGEQFDQALTLLPRIQVALQSGNIRAFLPPK